MEHARDHGAVHRHFVAVFQAFADDQLSPFCATIFTVRGSKRLGIDNGTVSVLPRVTARCGTNIGIEHAG